MRPVGLLRSPTVHAPEQPRSERFTTDALGGVDLHTLRWGDPTRPPLVLLHGGGANAWWWGHLAPHWAARFHVVALDFRGHGDSDYPEERRVGAFSDDLDALLEHLGRRPALLMGHSMGAHIALDRVARRGEACGDGGSDALVLVDLAWRAPSDSRRAARRALSMRMTYTDRDRALARFRFLPAAAHASERLRRSVAERSVTEEPSGRWGFKFDPRWFSLPYRKLPPLSGVRVPTLLVRGAESGLLSPESARGLVEELPDARLKEVGGAGHHVLMDQPEALREEVDAFLRATGVPARPGMLAAGEGDTT